MTIGLELHRTGTITYVPIGEGFYGIVSDDGGAYQNLVPISPVGYEDGQRVSFIATTREDYYSILSNSILQWGVPVEIISITKIGEVPSGELPGAVEAGMLSSNWYKSPWLWIAVGGFILLSGFGKVRKKK